MKYYQTFRFRLALRYALVLGVLLCLFSVGVYYGFRNLLYANLDASLVSIAESEVASSTDSETVHFHDVVTNPFNADAEMHLDKLVQLVTYPGGDLIGKNRNLGSMRLPLSVEARSHLDRGEVFAESVRITGSPQIRMITLPILLHEKVDYVMQVGASLLPLQTMLARLLWVLIIMDGCVLILTGAAGVYLARQALRPVDQLAGTIQDIAGQNLNQRLTMENPNDEFGRLTQVLNHMLERLEYSFQSQQRFVADASHEMRSPMATLQVALELALRRPRTPEEYRSSIDSALQDVTRLTGLINSLLLLSRADAGHLIKEQHSIRMKPLLEQLLEKYQAQARDKSITLECSLQEIAVSGDETCLRHLFANLLENALRYTPERGSIRLTECRQDDTVLISTEDTGIGIAPEHLPRLFERFYRVNEERARAEGGAGLGLAICDEIARAHGGKITVDSSLDHGSTFTVTLPVASV